MKTCLVCHKKYTGFHFPVIEIQTLHVRDISGEKYVQAMGESKEFEICSACAEQYLSSSRKPGSAIAKRSIPFAILILLGIAATIFLQRDAYVPFMRLLGPIAILCGIIGIAASCKNIIDQKNTLETLSPEEALRQASWFLVLKHAPKKNGDQDLTYVPVDSKTRSMNKQELALTYDLLPAIAEQVSKAIKKACSS